MAKSTTKSIQEVFAKRLRRARAMRGLSLRALSERLAGRVSYAALGKYEQGRMLPSSQVLISLATTLGVRPDYFFEEQSVTLGGIEFRKRSKLGKKQQARVVEEAQEYLERYLEVERILEIASPGLPQVDLRKRSAGDLPAAAEGAGAEVRKQWALGEGPLANVHELLEDRGVKVWEVEADAAFDGLSGWAGDAPVIVLGAWLNEDLPRKRMTQLHELGHLVMRLPAGLDKKQEEHLSFRFAGAMLIPKDQFLAEFGAKRRNGRVSQMELMAMKEQWGMSMAGIMRRALELELITGDHYKRFCIEANKAGWRKGEPGEWVGSEQACRFRQLAHRAAAQELITRTKAARLLGIGVREFDRDFGKAG